MNSSSLATIPTDFDIVSFLKQVVAEDRDISLAVAAVKSLTESIKYSKATTMSEFTQTLKAYSQTLKVSTPNTISISAGCDLFLQFVTRTGHDFSDFESCKHHIMKRGEIFVRKAWETRKKISEVGLPFIKDGAVSHFFFSTFLPAKIFLQRTQQNYPSLKSYLDHPHPLLFSSRTQSSRKSLTFQPSFQSLRDRIPTPLFG
jgi:translation initiation factor eIF-2B subunit alpha